MGSNSGHLFILTLTIALLIVGGVAGGEIDQIAAVCKDADCTNGGPYCTGFKTTNSNEQDNCNVAPSPSTCTHAFASLKRIELTDDFEVKLVGKVGKDGKPVGWVGIGFDANGKQDANEEKEVNGAPGLGAACLADGSVKLIELPEASGGTSGPVTILDDKHKHLTGGSPSSPDPDYPEWIVCSFKLKLPLFHEGASDRPIEYTYVFYTNPNEGAAGADGKLPRATTVTDSGMGRDDLSRISVMVTGKPGSGGDGGGSGKNTTSQGGGGGSEGGAAQLISVPGLLIITSVSVYLPFRYAISQ